jgi:hypothetical protein
MAEDKPSAEPTSQTNRRLTGKKDPAEVMARIVLEGLRGSERSRAHSSASCRPTTTPATRRSKTSSPHLGQRIGPSG